MRKHGVNGDRTLVDKGRFWLFLAVWLANPLMVWSQEENPLAPGVRILAALEGDAYDWSPDGKSLAYAAKDGIWVVAAPDFHQPRRLIRKWRCEADGSCSRMELRWSPDGQQLAFAGSRPGDGWSTIWVADADGSHVRDLLPPGAPFGSPGVRAVGISTWLSNREIAFEQHCGTECVAIHTVDAGSGTYRTLGDLEDAGDLYWAPTKNRAIVGVPNGSLGLVQTRDAKEFPSAEKPPPPSHFGVGGCYAEEEEMWKGEELRFNGWSPDGKRVLYTGRPCSEEPATESEIALYPRACSLVEEDLQEEAATESEIALYLWEVESGRRERLIPNAVWGAWSSDGSKIAFVLWGEPRYDPSHRIVGTDFAANKPLRASLGIIEVATRAVLTLVPLGPELMGLRGEYEQPLWSPDGKQLAMWDEQGDLVLLRADGSGRQPITRGMRVEASWSPDGKWLALWRIGRFVRSQESKGLERFLPPVGKEDTALSDAEIIERYFQQASALDPESPWFLAEYPKALEQLGKREAAEEQYRKAIEVVQHSEQWRNTGVETEVENSYVAFLCGQGRKKEAAEFIASVPAMQPWERLRVGRLRSLIESPSCGEGKEAEAQGGPGPATALPLTGASIVVGSDLGGTTEAVAPERTPAPPPAVPQQSPSLYIVELQERVE